MSSSRTKKGKSSQRNGQLKPGLKDMEEWFTIRSLDFDAWCEENKSWGQKQT